MTRRMSERRTSIIGAMLATIGPISMSIYTPAMPELVTAFGSTEAVIKLTLSVYFAGFAMAQLLAGPMSDAFGRRPATVGFVGVYMLGSLIAAFAPSVEWLLAGRLVQGVGASVGMTVARAIVRDQFVGAESARIMNLIGIMLAIGPAIAPTIGGLALATFGWQSIFFLLVGFGLMLATVVLAFMRETSVPDRSRARPAGLAKAYGELVLNARFISAVIVLGGSVGALYAQATMLPFILIGKVGMTPTAFGLGMMMQSGAYFFGSISLRFAVPKLGGEGSVRAGLSMLGLGGLMMAISVRAIEPSYLTIMVPVAFLTFGIAFLTPHMSTAALSSFPHIAGSASAMMGFIQMTCGFLGGLAAALIGMPTLAFGTVIPLMVLTAILSYVWFLRATQREVLAAAPSPGE